MKKEDIKFDDVKRILFGEAPPIFLLEVFIRTLIIYIILLVVTRWLGKRMSGQLTIMEMTIMLTLGAIVSVAMQVPDRGIVLSTVVLLVTLSIQQLTGRLSFKFPFIQQLTEGRTSILVKDGVLILQEMKKCRISKQQLFAKLRCEQVYNLGSIKRVYLESNGLFSIYFQDETQKGLSILPSNDTLTYDSQETTNEFACANCGHVQFVYNKQTVCNNCGEGTWMQAISVIK